MIFKMQLDFASFEATTTMPKDDYITFMSCSNGGKSALFVALE